jgi:hypothetical protein
MYRFKTCDTSRLVVESTRDTTKMHHEFYIKKFKQFFFKTFKKHKHCLKMYHFKTCDTSRLVVEATRDTTKMHHEFVQGCVYERV